ncbi:hypothetical protein FAY30_21405 [Bacillus sp. S3]|nr:hypothetical protein FAY30_21405 [Bacillus sp. S3]
MNFLSYVRTYCSANTWRGLSRIYLVQQSPSDVVAGYVFGGVWLSLNILVLEIFRFTNRLNKLKQNKSR